MPLSSPCPKCEDFALRKSKSRSFKDKFIKRLTPYSVYRCHDCGWRGWISKNSILAKRPMMIAILASAGWVLLLFVLGLLVAALITK